MARNSADGVGRRQFLRYLLGFSIVTSIGMVAWPVIRFLIPPSTSAGVSGGKIEVGSVEEVPVGSAKVLPVAGKPTIVVNTDQGIKAFSAICTHLGCIVAWDAVGQNIVCPCHDGRFNPTTGAVISGPPPNALAPMTATIEDDTIYVVAG